MYASVRGTRIYFDVEGAGLVPQGDGMRQRPEAMIIHGGPGGDHSGLKPALSPLRESMQLVYFDHRGQGRSACGDPATYTLDDNVEDMEALRRHLGLGPVVSIGTSYGGMVAMAHAARYPESVSHLERVAGPVADDDVATVGGDHEAGRHQVAQLHVIGGGTDGEVLDGDDE